MPPKTSIYQKRGHIFFRITNKKSHFIIKTQKTKEQHLLHFKCTNNVKKLSILDLSIVLLRMMLPFPLHYVVAYQHKPSSVLRLVGMFTIRCNRSNGCNNEEKCDLWRSEMERFLPAHTTLEVTPLMPQFPSCITISKGLKVRRVSVHQGAGC